MTDHHLKASDYIAATFAVLPSLTLAQWNSFLGCVGSGLGISYLLWKWRKEAKRRETNSPFYDRNARRNQRGKNRQRHHEP
jgi:hypothetical protein